MADIIRSILLVVDEGSLMSINADKAPSWQLCDDCSFGGGGERSVAFGEARWFDLIAPEDYVAKDKAKSASRRCTRSVLRP